ncbi:hypothetical protein OG474_00780 [Kribbella sp. NBC_01505]|uniref:helix-turn-helix transcriptional regulator n=1 Tax=Kribbella sp. NBC_01505 TaxID=2903580 RepID=UPI003868A03B
MVLEHAREPADLVGTITTAARDAAADGAYREAAAHYRLVLESAGLLTPGERSRLLTEYARLRLDRSRVDIDRGAWDDAVEAASAVLRTSSLPHRCTALELLARVGSRRGEASAADLVASVVAHSHESGDLEYMARAAAVAAEAAWLTGDHSAVAGIALGPFTDAYHVDLRSVWPELGYWLTRAGHIVAMSTAGGPFQLLASGNWREAAELWARAGRRYETAMAWSESDSPEHLLKAVEELDSLGAKPLARIAGQRLHQLGIGQISRGAAVPQNHPADLDHSEFEVLRLLVEGLTTDEIARQLTIPVPAVDKYVAVVIDRLSAGILGQPGQVIPQAAPQNPADPVCEAAGYEFHG